MRARGAGWRPESHSCKLNPVGDLPVISLFSGVGGLDVAVERAGPLRVAVGVEWEDDEVTTLQANFEAPVLQGDIRTVSTRQILRAAGLRKGEAALVIGGPPCTPFSKSGFWLDYKKESRDPNASLLDEFARVVEEARPEAFVLENVYGLTYKTHSAQFARLLKRLDSAGYRPRWKVVNAADYGVPQLRKRVFVLGRRDGAPVHFPGPTHSGWSEHSKRIDLTKQPYVTAGEVLWDLLPGVPEPEEVVDGTFGHVAAEIPPGQNYLWFSERGGGDRFLFKWRSRYWTFLLRLDPDRPATTLQSSPGPWVGPFHWKNVKLDDGQERARRLRVPEMKRLMTFPDDYQVVGDRRSVQRQLGNAVPPELGRVIIQDLIGQLGHVELSEERAVQLAFA
jgi:DNA (cytosine-5)-methyltransferase 1